MVDQRRRRTQGLPAPLPSVAAQQLDKLLLQQAEQQALILHMRLQVSAHACCGSCMYTCRMLCRHAKHGTRLQDRRANAVGEPDGRLNVAGLHKLAHPLTVRAQRIVHADVPHLVA